MLYNGAFIGAVYSANEEPNDKSQRETAIDVIMDYKDELYREEATNRPDSNHQRHILWNGILLRYVLLSFSALSAHIA